jgi:archaemetzincin
MITIVPIGDVSRDVLEVLGCRLEEVFAQGTRLAEGIPLTEEGWNRKRRQYLAPRLLAGLPRPENVQDRVLGVLEGDIFTPGLNFVFGQADIPGGRAIIQLQRLRPEFYGLPRNEELLCERALTEAVHELGHTYGLMHCSNPKCAMYFSNSLYDTDIKGWEFCPGCQQQLEKNMAGRV